MTHDTRNHSFRTYTIMEGGQMYTIKVEAGMFALAADLAHKAIRNKSKRTKLCRGAIVVTCVGKVQA